VLQRQDTRERDVTLAWTIVNLAAATLSKRRVPELAPLLEAMRSRRPQTVAEQRAVLELLAQRLGRRLTTRHDRKGQDGRSRQPTQWARRPADVAGARHAPAAGTAARGR